MQIDMFDNRCCLFIPRRRAVKETIILHKFTLQLLLLLAQYILWVQFLWPFLFIICCINEHRGVGISGKLTGVNKCAVSSAWKDRFDCHKLMKLGMLQKDGASFVKLSTRSYSHKQFHSARLKSILRNTRVCFNSIVSPVFRHLYHFALSVYLLLQYVRTNFYVHTYLHSTSPSE